MTHPQLCDILKIASAVHVSVPRMHIERQNIGIVLIGKNFDGLLVDIPIVWSVVLVVVITESKIATVSFSVDGGCFRAMTTPTRL